MPKKYQGFGGEELRRELDAIMTVTSPSLSQKSERGKKTVGEKSYQDHRSRQDTETLIKNCILDSGKPMSVMLIARCLDRTASPHFRSIVADMVKSGALIESVDIAPNGRMVRYLYSLP